MPFVKRPDGTLGMQHITVEWHRARAALANPTNISIVELAVDGREVGDARNYAVKSAMELHRPPEMMLFIDSDVLIQHDALTKLLYRARHYPEYDIFAGVYCSKSSLPEPLLYMQDGGGPYWDWTLGDLVFDLSSVAMGCTLIRMSLFEKMEYTDEKPWFYTRNERTVVDGFLQVNRGTEDIFFCNKAREEAGAKIMADTSILCGHQDLETGRVYGMPTDSGPIQRARWHPIHNEEDGELKKALDIGAGPSRRHWDGHKTYTLDIRPETDCDYTQDSRSMNLPDEHFDIVASSHHLEHVGRWDQETVWKEIFRVCKPGGNIEIIVPNVTWAAQLICDGHVDEHVQNVLYGAQEKHGYARDLNTHYFGYTPEIGRALAESVGFTDVTVETYKDNPDRVYEMVIRGARVTEDHNV